MGAMINPYLTEERRRSKRLWQIQNSRPSSLTLRPVSRTQQVADLGSGFEEAGIGWGCPWRGEEASGTSTIKLHDAIPFLETYIDVHAFIHQETPGTVTSKASVGS